jgi:hypothetical protein
MGLSGEKEGGVQDGAIGGFELDVSGGFGERQRTARRRWDVERVFGEDRAETDDQNQEERDERADLKNDDAAIMGQMI